MQRAEFILEGRVQGVGLRYLIQEEASRRRINGYVRNLENGTVELVCEGRREDIDGLLESARAFQDPVMIENVKSKYSEGAAQYTTFSITHDGLEDEVLNNMPKDQALIKMIHTLVDETTKGFSTGSMYLRSINSKQDQMLDKQDQMLDKQDQMLDKQDQMLDKQDQTIGAIHELSSNVKDMLDSRFQRLENDVAKIKTKLEI